MNSPLSFSATQQLRNNLLVRNLPPYTAEAFNSTTSPADGGYVQDNYSVVDSEPLFNQTENASVNMFLKNRYGPPEGYTERYIQTIIDNIIGPRSEYFTFVSSFYSPGQILLSNDPTGTNGPLSEDSELAKIGAERLKSEFEARIAQEIFQETLGRANIIGALSDPYDLLNIVSGNNEVIEPNWNISVPDSLVGKGLDFISRITDVYSPFSWIPGDYFSNDNKKSIFNQVLTEIGLNSRGKLQTEKTPMDVWIANTGKATRDQLFRNLKQNQYTPDYRFNFLSNPNLNAPQGLYYLGDRNVDIGDLVAPQNELPLDKFNQPYNTAVRGYGIMATTLESGNNGTTANQFKFGLNAPNYADGGNLQSGLSWVNSESPIGIVEGPSGYQSSSSNLDTNFDSTRSTDQSFASGTILDNTQRLVNSAAGLQGDKKLQHVGNAIDQVSKIFHDGIRKITKGSQVVRYVNQSDGIIVGEEYARVFTKDMPYSKMLNLQKTEGNIRKFSYSVLDNTYNLNIAPNRGTDSTNIIEGDEIGKHAKKYMLSLENLAWRTSSTPGYTYDDLPACEKGPNGGRVMWFAPYDLSFDENSSVQWNSNSFLGRPEPVYTYQNTDRNGSLRFKIVVDHPSILNAIADKELKNINTIERVNGVIESFLAGARTYDIYELATRFPQFTYSDIYNIVTKTQDISVYQGAEKEVNPQEPADNSPVVADNTNVPQITTEDYSFNFYFDNDEPGPNDANVTTSTENYQDLLLAYISQKSTYISNADASEQQSVNTFFDQNIETISSNLSSLTQKIGDALVQGSEVKITIQGNTSASGSQTYNDSLAKRRINTIKNYITSFQVEDKQIGEYLNDLLTFDEQVNAEGQIDGYDCSQTGNEIYTVRAMACRSAFIRAITVSQPLLDTQIVEDENSELKVPEVQNEETSEKSINGKTKIPQQTSSLEFRQDVSKIVVRKLLTECDYFQQVQAETPLVFDSMREKLKYFHPAFHSTTPEGLNGRLTFLQQCLRPGETIPIISEDGEIKREVAKNTAFGAPPICVLRIGDFYHTKIAINQLSIQYEPLLDINPEGIGVQPMIASVTLSFYFIGGSGLKEPIQQLQNALSFNYYANTEMYDERAESTENRDDINKQVQEAIQNETEFGLQNNVTNQGQENQTTIGVIQNENLITVGSNETLSGETSYKEISNQLIDDSKNYVNNIVSTIQTISDRYSVDGLKYYTAERNYTTGLILGYFGSGSYYTGTTQGLDIFGKSKGLQDRIETLYSQTINDVNNETGPLFKNIGNQNFRNRDKKKYVNNIINLIQNTKQEYLAEYDKLNTDLVNNQLNLIQTVDKLNFILTNSDGYANRKNTAFIYELTATTEVSDTSNNPTPTNTYQELENDISKVGTDLQSFYDLIFASNVLMDPTKPYNDTSYDFSGLNTLLGLGAVDIRLANILYYNVINNTNKVIEDLLAGGLQAIPEWNSYVTKLVKTNSNSLYRYYNTLKNWGESKVARFNLESIVEKFEDEYKPYDRDKERKFNYIKTPSSLTDQTKKGFFDQIYSTKNSGNSQTFNGKKSFN